LCEVEDRFGLELKLLGCFGREEIREADLLRKAGRKILVQFVLMLIYLAMALDLPSSALKAIDKLRIGFLWK
jgi:hypothetical protein